MTAEVITYRDSEFVQHADEASTGASHILNKVSTSLDVNVDDLLDRFLCVLENHGDFTFKRLAQQMRNDLGTTGTALNSIDS